MSVNPSDSTTVDFTASNELDYFSVCDRGRLAHHFIRGKKVYAKGTTRSTRGSRKAGVFLSLLCFLWFLSPFRLLPASSFQMVAVRGMVWPTVRTRASA